MSWNYVVTAQKPTAVSHSLVGNFTSPKDINLIISKGTRIEVHLSTPDGLQPMLDLPIYGRIASMELYRPQGEQQDLLFICTERKKFCVLKYEADAGEIHTKAVADVQDRNGRDADVGQIATIDPECRAIGLHLYDGLFKVIPAEKTGALKEGFNLRLEELQVLDIKFLHGMTKPSIAILYQEKESRHVKTYEVNVRDKELPEITALRLPNVENGASLLIPLPLPLGGVAVIGETTITYHSATTTKSIAMSPTIVKAFAKVDVDASRARYLLGDHLGILYMLVIDHSSGDMIDMKLETLGETSSASTLSYLDNGVVFVGSSHGDSQLISLVAEKDENGSFLKILESYTNLGPIVDFCVVDLERQGQGQVVSCSGAFKDGSLRVVRSGIGINEQASIDLPGIKGIWSLREGDFDKYIIMSFVGETRVLAMSGEELEEIEFAGFQSDEQTLYCGNAGAGQFVQVTSKGILLVDSATQELTTKWAPPGNNKINVASCVNSQVLVALGGGHLVYIEILGKEINVVSEVTLEHEIACVNISPLGDSHEIKSKVSAVGMWTDISVRLLEVPSLKLITKESLGGEVIPRSVLLTTFEGINYLLCALGDGHLFTFTLHENYEMRDKKKVTLGTQPIMLNTFHSNGTTHVFAASDRPTVIYSSNKKLLYSNVNLKEVNYMSGFHSESFSDSLAIATEESLKIGTIDDIQKLHIRTVPLGGEMARRVAHQESSGTFAILTMKTNGNEAQESGFVRILDDQTFEVTSSFPLDANEHPGSIVSCGFGEESGREYFVVGTAYVYPDEAEPSKGRILIFEVSDKQLKLVTENPVNGSVYCLNAFNKKVLAGVNNKVELFTMNEDDKKLRLEATHHGHILALYLASRGDFIIVGDLMRSISLLLCKTTTGNDQTSTYDIEEIARDYNSNWMTAVDVIDDDTFIGAENSFNIFTVRRNSGAATDEERSSLEVTGQYHLGEF
eukprot:TRINITY_DN8377_c0_g1_i1.p1 TRINITY_DN8377_c0_g1~~TRINITY_DN8377_c0_g1_i1.p1  ORF type:complete len:965 (-),score=280.18 TRINITY_DN8377_c0_g1_i1:487-3381(-)